MKLFICVFIFFIPFQIMGVSEEPPIPKSTESSQTRITQSNLTTAPNAFVGMVNVITGDLVDHEVDLVIPGPNPIVIERSYSSSFDEYGSLEYGWDLNHSMRLNTSYDDKTFFETGDNFIFHFKANLNEGQGAITQFEGRRGNNKASLTQTCIDQGMTNCGKGEISGKTNPKNRYALQKNKERVEENWLLVDGTGTTHLFTGKLRVEGRDLELAKTTFPNGNHFSYRYDKKMETSHCKLRTPQGWLLGEFKMSNRQLDKQNYEIRVDFLNGRNIYYRFQGRPSKWQLSYVNRPDAPPVDYSYHQNTARISKKAYPNNRYVNVAYWQKGHKDGTRIHSGDARINRVSGLAEPVGTDESPVQTYRFSYELKRDGKEGKTKVYDAYENLTTYQYNSEQRLHHIEYYGDRPTFYRRESYFWGNGAQKGNLIAQRIDNQDGVALIARTLRYDDRGNPLEEHLYGNLTGQNIHSPHLGNDSYAIPNGCESTIKVCTYSNDGCNSKLSEEENGQKTVYSYIPGKDQLEAKYIYDGNTIKKRHFYTYDLRGLQTGETIDDGSSVEKNNMEDVHQRTIHLISGRNKMPVCLTEYEYQNYIDEHGEEKRARHLFNMHDPFGRLIEQHHYDSDDNLRYRLHWEYDGQGNVIREVTAIGEEILRKYDENQNVIYECGPNKDYHTDFFYDYMNRLIREEKVDHADGKKYITSHRYDRRSNRTATIDWMGNETIFTYDAFNRLVKTTFPPLPKPDGTLFYPEESMAYNTLGHLSEIADRNGNQTVQQTTIRGQPFLITYPDGSQEKMNYNLDGTLQQKTEKNGMIIQYTYDYQQRPVSTQSFSETGEALGSTYIAYSAFNPIQEIDANGNITTFQYDRLGRLSAVLKENAAEYYTYDPLGRKHSTKTYFGHQENDYTLQILEYDLLDRIVEERLEDAAGTILCKETCVYDKSGNKTQINTYSDAGTGTTTITYNIHSQPIKTVDAEGNTTYTNYLYDYKDTYGQVVSYAETTDPKGNVTITIGNTAGQTGMEQRKNTFGELIQQREYFYDGMGQLIQTQDTVFAPNQPTYTVINAWIYNAMGEVTNCIEAVGTPEQKHTSHLYNVFGQKESTQKPDGTLILYTYDDKGRLETVSASDKTLSYTYAYDLNDNPIQIIDNVNTHENKRAYDQNNQLIAETLGNGLHLTYTYDRQGRLLTVTLPDQTQIAYTYNATDLVEVKRLSSIGEVAYSQTYQYDQAANLTQTILPFALGKIDKTYDLLLRHRATKAPHFSETEIQYDPCGNLISRSFNDPLGKLPCSYAYDDLYQLSKEEGLSSHTYQHDSLYNRVQRDGLQLKINALNQLLNDHKGSYSYDPNGNLAESNTQKYAYDAWDRLLSVTEGKIQTTYQYDDQHRRLSKTSSTWDPITNSWIAKKTIYYLYLGQNEIGACDSRLNITELRILGHGRGAEIGAAVALELNGEVIIPLFDFAGNTRVLLDTTGKPLDTYRYTAFGEENLSEKAQTAWRFCSKRTDEETGFVYFGRRYYNPHSGRWITADPLGYEAGPNLYAYVNNNPLTIIDLYGLEGRDWLDERREQQVQERRNISGYEKQDKSPVHDTSWNSARESVGGLASGYLDPLSSASKFGGYAGQLASAAWSGDYTEISEKLKNKSFSWFAGRAGEALGLALNVVPAIKMIQGAVVAVKVGCFVAKETAKFTCKKVTQIATLKGATQATTKAAQVGKQLVAKEARVVAKKKIKNTSFLFKKGGPLRDPVTQNYLPDPKALGRAHTTLGIRQGRSGSYIQGATFDSQGIFRGRTDVTDHGRHDHFSPHFHPSTSPNGVETGAHSIPDL